MASKLESGRKKTGGRQKGTPNRVSADVKSMVLQAFEMVGGSKYLVQQSIDNPVAFMGLIGKVLPKQVEATIEHSADIKLSIPVEWYPDNTDS